MQMDEYERVRNELKQAESVFRKAKDDIFSFPKALHPMAAASKAMMMTFEQLYPKESPYYAVGADYSVAFSGLVAIYNDEVVTWKDVVASAEEWFTHLKTAKDLIAMRDKSKKEFDHYDKKVAKMRTDRQNKVSRNPKSIETPKEVEWYLRNDRKYDTAKNNYITSSQQSYMSAKECLDLRYEYMNPVMNNFAKYLIKFYKNVDNSFVNLGSINDKIVQGQQIVKQRAEEAKLAELRVAEEKIMKERQDKERAVRDKAEAERLSQEKIIKEREDKERELAAKYGQQYPARPESQPRPRPGGDGARRPRPPPAAAGGYGEDSYGYPPAADSYDSAAGAGYYDEPQYAPRPAYRPRPQPRPRPRPAPQADSYGDDMGFGTAPQPGYGTRPAPAARPYAGGDDYYTEAQPDYYQPPPRPALRPPPRARAPRPAPSAYSGAGDNDWGMLQPRPAPMPAAAPQPAYATYAPDPNDPFAEMDAPAGPATGYGAGMGGMGMGGPQGAGAAGYGKKPRNPFATNAGPGGYGARPPPQQQQYQGGQGDQYDMFGL